MPVGTGEKLRAVMEEKLTNLNKGLTFEIVSNPEFLREGSAVGDFLQPDRVVIGLERPDSPAKAVMLDLYRPLNLGEGSIIVTDVRSAEVIKYASNSFLATKISFINEMANFCQLCGADVEAVAQGMGLDKRIGSQFLRASLGYGGSCFPKDVAALIQTGRQFGYQFQIIQAAEAVNQKQRALIVEMLSKEMALDSQTIAVWGLAFKANTDDIRESAPIEIIQKLLGQNRTVKIRAYDPAAGGRARQLFEGEDRVKIVDDAISAAKGAAALLVLTEWDEFLTPDFSQLKKSLTKPLIIDGRNLYDPAEVRQQGFTYLSIGRK